MPPRLRRQPSLAFPAISIILACLALFCLSSCGSEKPKSRMEKRVCIYLNKMEDSAVALENKLDAIAAAKVLNTPDRMRQAARMIEEAEALLDEANQDVRSYLAFINANRGALESEKLHPYIRIKGLLNHELTQKRRAMNHYFVRMDAWLTYSADHYAQLKAKDVRSRKSYDSLLIAVNRSQQEYELANAEYHQFVDQFLAQHPELKKKFKHRYKTMKKELGWL